MTDATVQSPSLLSDMLGEILKAENPVPPSKVTALSQLYSAIESLQADRSPNQAVHEAIRKAESLLCKLRGGY